ncbi:outer membrane beta-barrel protein [Flavivirga eckloniae]|uniref:outer membrane beta-barrel protein n=1 Tax=Flavivirga eckloniae TaxID=1803846 RepID=UPI001315152E|nr:outer membrane beta-barrel protein [Flavivirga eckloniae]
MKKLLLCATIAVFVLSSANAQEVNFGVKAGADFASSKVKRPLFDVSFTGTGFYIGGFANIGLSDALSFQPEVLYVSVSTGGNTGLDFDEIHIPLMGKFAVSEKFAVLAGPALGILLDAGEGTKSFNYGIEAGAAFNITYNFFVEARYNIGLANLSDNVPGINSSKISGFFTGVGYRF